MKNSSPTLPPATRRACWSLALLVLSLAPVASRAADADTPALPTVAVTTVTREDLFNEVTVQGELRPYQEIDLHAKASGYLKQITVDIGDTVKAGDLIGTLEVPELEDDLAGAEAVQQRAEADEKESRVAYNRLLSVSQSRRDLVAQQEIDSAEEKASAAAAALEAARAAVRKYQTLSRYTAVSAPFNGVITKRYADPGALIQAGTTSDTQTKPLVRLSENDRLRLVFAVSATYADAIKLGDQVEIRVDNQAQPLAGVISRFARRINLETRTMETEVEVPNPDLRLIPGMDATVVLHLQRRPQALAVPVEAVAGTGQPTVFVINREHIIEERAVRLGLETPTKFEVLSGLREGEQVMIGNRAQVRAGQKVAVQVVKTLAAL